MSAELGPRGGTALMSRGGERGLSRSVIASRSEAISSTRLPRRSAPRNEGRRQRTISRQEFAAKYRPFTPLMEKSPQPPFSKGGAEGGEFRTRKFSTYRDGATMHRSSIDQFKREISTTIKKESSQFRNSKTPEVSLIKKVSLEKKPFYAQPLRSRENTRVSLSKRVSLEKNFSKNVKPPEIQKISLLKPVNLEKKQRSYPHPDPLPKREREFNSISLVNPVSLEKRINSTVVGDLSEMTKEMLTQTRQIEQPSWIAEKQPQRNEQIIFQSANIQKDNYQQPEQVGFINIDAIRRLEKNRDKPVELRPDDKVIIIFRNQTQVMKHRNFLILYEKVLKNEDFTLRHTLFDQSITTFHPKGEINVKGKENQKKKKRRGEEQQEMRQKEREEEWNEPLCCNHHCELKDRKNGIGTCPKSGILFTYDEFAKEKAAKENRPVRRSDWNVKNTFVRAIQSAFIQPSMPQGLTR